MATRKAVKKASLVETKATSTPTSPVNKPSIVDKLKQPKYFFPLIIIAILAVGAFFLKGLFIAALVNGQPISRFSIIQQLEKQGGQQALAALVNQTLISQEAEKKNVQVTQKEIDDGTQEIEDALKKQGQNLDTALATQGMTREDFREQIKLRKLVEKLLADKTKVTDKEVSDYIEKNKETLPADMKEEELKKNVKEQLEQEKLASESQKWIEELNKNAKINYFINY